MLVVWRHYWRELRYLALNCAVDSDQLPPATCKSLCKGSAPLFQHGLNMLRQGRDLQGLEQDVGVVHLMGMSGVGPS